MSFLQLQRKASFQLLGRRCAGSAAEWRGPFWDAERVWGGFFGMLKVRLIFLSKSDAKSEPSGIPFLAHFFDFSCTAQGLERLSLFGTIFEPSPKGKSRCFVKDIL